MIHRCGIEIATLSVAIPKLPPAEPTGARLAVAMPPLGELHSHDTLSSDRVESSR
jgi:hypothetical protein